NAAAQRRVPPLQAGARKIRVLRGSIFSFERQRPLEQLTLRRSGAWRDEARSIQCEIACLVEARLAAGAPEALADQVRERPLATHALAERGFVVLAAAH